MRRREFITLIGGTAAAWPLAAPARDEGKLRTIGVLGDNADVFKPWLAGFAERMHELGWVEGRTLAIERRWSEGRRDRTAEIAAEFALLKVDVIVTYGGAVPIVKQATTSIPVVFAIALSHPGGNVTGISIQVSEIGGKRLELFREIVPGLRRLAILFDGGYAGSVRESGEVQAMARTLGFEVVPQERSRATRDKASGGYRTRFRCAERPNGRTLRRRKRSNGEQPRAHRHAGAQSAIADNIRRRRFGESRGPHGLRTKHLGSIPRRRRVRR